MGESEKNEITDRLDKLIGLQESHEEKLTSIDDLLRGTYEKQGLITRVCGLERTEADRRCWHRITIGAAITSAIGAAMSWIKHVGPH